MNFEEMQIILGGILQVQKQLQESQLRAEERMGRLEDNLAKTEAITNSNARSILANTETSDRRMTAIENKLSQLIEIVGT